MLLRDSQRNSATTHDRADRRTRRNILLGEVVLSSKKRLKVYNHLEAVVDRFLVISPHTGRCKQALAEVLAAGYITISNGVAWMESIQGGQS